HLVDAESVKLAAAAVLFSPFLPLIFMGEEYAETAPFLYFVDHQDPKLRQAVARGRREEFKKFHAPSEVPDPGAASTFERSVLNHSLKGLPSHKTRRNFYKRLLHLRRELLE